MTNYYYIFVTQEHEKPLITSRSHMHIDGALRECFNEKTECFFSKAVSKHDLDLILNNKITTDWSIFQGPADFYGWKILPRVAFGTTHQAQKGFNE